MISPGPISFLWRKKKKHSFSPHSIELIWQSSRIVCVEMFVGVVAIVKDCWWLFSLVGTRVFVGFDILRAYLPILRFQVSNQSPGNERRGKRERGVWESREKTLKLWKSGALWLALHMENRTSGPNSSLEGKITTGLFWHDRSHPTGSLPLSYPSLLRITQMSLSSSCSPLSLLWYLGFYVLERISITSH